MGIEAHDPLPQVVRSRVGLLEIARQPGQEIGQAEAGARAVKGKVAILVEAGDGVVLHADEAESEGHLMAPADHIHVVGHVVAVEVEMPRGARSAEGAESAGHAHQQEVRHGAVHVDSEQGRVDGNIRRPAVVTPTVEGEVKRVQRCRSEGVVVPDRDRLGAFEVARLCGGEHVLTVVGGRILEVIEEVPSKQGVLFGVCPVDAPDVLLLVARDRNGISDFTASIGCARG